MSLINRADALALKPVPVSFDPPTIGQTCHGQQSINGKTLGLCICCERMGGSSIPPAATVRSGLAECVNFAPLVDAAYYARPVSRDASVSADQGGVCLFEHTATVPAPVRPVSPPALGGCSVRQQTDGAAS